MYENMYVSADSNVKKINFDLQNKVSQRITRNGSDIQSLASLLDAPAFFHVM